MNAGGALARAWRRYRGWRWWVQGLVALLALMVVTAPFAPPPEESTKDTELASTSDGTEPDVADELPRASTTTELVTTTTEAPTTTSPPPTTAPPTTAPRPTAPPTTAARRAPEPPPTVVSEERGGGCHPDYGGCVPIASDVDCAGGDGNGPAYVAGPVESHGSDPYDLDRDGDGVGCED